MADSVVGALRVLLGLDTAAFSDGLNDASKQVNKFAKSLGSDLTKATAAAGAAFTAVAGGIAVAVKHSINEMDNLGKLSQKIGVPVEQLSALKVAAELSDVSIEALGKGMSKLSTEMVAAAAGGAGPAASAFQALGISMETLKQNDPSKTLEVIAERFKGFADGATKTALANAILGQRMGRELIPLLNQGAEGLRQAKENAIAFGQVISEKTAKQAETFNDNLKLMALIPSGIGNAIAEKLLPKLVELSDQMVKWAKDNNVVQRSAEVLVKLIALVVDNLDWLARVFGAMIALRLGTFFIQLGISVYGFATALYEAGVAMALFNVATSKWVRVLAIGAAAVAVAAGTFGDFKEKLGEIGQLITEKIGALDIAAKVEKGLQTIGVNTRALKGDLSALGPASNEAAEGIKKIKPPPAFDPAASAAGQKFNDELLKIGLRAKEIRGDFDQLAPGFVQAATSLKLIKDTGDGFIGTLDTLTPKQLALNNALLGLQAAQMIKDSQTPMEEYAQRIERIIQLQDQQKISAEVAADQSLKAWIKMQDSYLTAMSTALGGFSQMFMAFGAHSKKMFEIGKAFAIAEAVINTYKAANLALAQPPGPPFSYIYVAGAIAAGIANVMKITSQKAPTMATGGQIQVAGAGGIDSRLVPIMATPGERINVEQNKYGATTATGSVVTIQGINAKDYYRGDVLRDFVANLNEAIGDGLKIKMA